MPWNTTNPRRKCGCRGILSEAEVPISTTSAPSSKVHRELTILFVFGLCFRRLHTLDDLPRLRVLDVLLGLALQELLRDLLQVLLATISRKNGRLCDVLELFLLIIELLVKDLSLGRVGIDVDVIPSCCRLPCVELELLDLIGVSGMAKKVVSCEERLVHGKNAA